MTAPGSGKHTRHHVIGIDDPAVRYRPGDALGVKPDNDPVVVARLLRRVGARGDERLDDSDRPLAERLTSDYSLTTPSRRLLGLLAERGGAGLGRLLQRGQEAALRAWLHGPDGHDVLDTLEACRPMAVSPRELVDSLRTLQPRLYSVASSQRVHPGEVHLLVVSHRFTIRGRSRVGVTSDWLNARWPIGAAADVYLQDQQAHFSMPADPDTPMIMIGAGTGIAPYRGFLEERQAAGARGPNWLFFGEQHRATEFYYADQLLAWERDGLLRLDTAFSRDQPERIYVQDRMRAAAPDLWSWIDAGARVFVCGDKARMAADVDRALGDVVRLGSQRTDDQAREYVRQMRTDGRYQRDVY